MKAPEVKHHGIVRNGKKIYYDREMQENNLRQLEGKEFDEIIKEKSKKPSKDTHGFYRGGIIKTCLTTEQFGGWEAEEVDDFFCNMFLKRIVEKEYNGKRKEVVHIDTTGSLNQKEMNEFIQSVIVWLTSEGIKILNPEQYNLTKYRYVNND